ARRAGGVGVLALLLAARVFAFGFADHPSKPTDLGGQWQLNTALSDDVNKQLEAHQAKLRALMEKARRRAPRQIGPSLYPTEEEVMGSGPIRMTPEPLLTVERYDRLRINQSSERFAVEAQNPSGHIDHQSYDPGEKSVVSFGAGVADRR